MSTANQQTLVESGAEARPPILEKGSCVPWASQFLRFLDNKREEGELMRHSIDNDPYKWKEIVDPNDDTKTIIEPVKNFERNSRLMNEFDKFVAADGESLTSVYESPSYSRSTQPYYVTHPLFVIDYDDDYQREIQGDAKEDKHLSVMIQDGRMDIQSKNVGYDGNGNMYAGRTNNNQATNTGNGLVQKIKEHEHNVQRIPRTESIPGKTNEQMLLATKDKVGVHLDEEENDFMLDNAYGDNTLEDLNAPVIIMAHIQPTDDKSDTEPTYDTEIISEVNASQIDMINGDYVENNSGQAEHDTNAHDQPFPDFESLINNVQVEAENQRKMNIELKKQKALLQRELETCKEWVKEFEKKRDQFINYFFWVKGYLGKYIKTETVKYKWNVAKVPH
ncbi:hypothetical protein Tco_0210285 [Tanacetum coccineum]